MVDCRRLRERCEREGKERGRNEEMRGDEKRAEKREVMADRHAVEQRECRGREKVTVCAGEQGSGRGDEAVDR